MTPPTLMTIEDHIRATQQEAQGKQMGRRCPTCHLYPFYYPHGTAICQGHVYSQNGRAELGITGMCEFCWDSMENEYDRAERTGGAIDPDAPRDLPLVGQVLQTVTNLNDYDVVSGRYDTTDKEAAQVITSLVAKSQFGGGRKHKVVVDIDMPAALIPSSTPGHYHLYIDHEIPEEIYLRLLQVMGEAGLLEPGYVRASQDRKLTAVRLPWVKKPSKTPEELVDEYIEGLEDLPESPAFPRPL